MRNYFYGWYFKCQSDTQTLAIIPAYHKSENKRSCSIQLITNDGSWNINLPCKNFSLEKKTFRMKIRENRFGKKGIKLCLHTPECSVMGALRFGMFSPLLYDIMGPFKYLPFMECRHSIISMRHTVNGVICINGVNYRFRNSPGYIEGDSGYSFPKRYAWTHCFFKNGSMFLSVADIPIGPLKFTGVIGIIKFKGKEYRLATYLGAKAIKIKNGEIVIRQGNSLLSVRLLKKSAMPLAAPKNGAMCRTIRENISCRASYCFKQNGQTLFSFISSKASFEYEYDL